MDTFKKKTLTLRQYLAGSGYYEALTAMEFAGQYHTGVRKDGVTPEFDHQISIALYALTLPDLMYREEVITTILYHDLREDHGITEQEIRDRHPHADAAFLDRVCAAVEHMTKEWRGVRKNEVKLFEEMAEDPVASIAKGCDRIHNLQTMVRVFTATKQQEYVEEVETLFLPMIKKAKKRFPHQRLAYENIKHMLVSQIDLIKAIHGV